MKSLREVILSSSEEELAPRNGEDRAQVPEVSIQQGSSMASPYPRGDLIDQVASRKASQNQIRQFHSQAMNHEAFYQQAIERLDIYSAGSEEGKRKKLTAVLKAVKVDRMRITAAASSQQAGKAGEEGGKSKGGSPTRKKPAASKKPPPRPTQEEKLAQQYRLDLDQVNRHLQELEMDSEIKPLSQASADLATGIRTMHFQAAQQLATSKCGLTQTGRGGAAAPRGTAELIEAVEKIHAANSRFTELSMLAGVSGPRAKARAEEVSARLARVLRPAATTAVSRSP